MGFGGSRDDNFPNPPATSTSHHAALSYLTGLCVAALGMCAGGWLVLTPFAFGYPARGRAAVTALATGGGLVAVCLVTLACWATLWRRRLRADGVLRARRSRRSRRSARRQARAERLVRAARQRDLVAAPDPAQVLTDLRALLTPLLADGPISADRDVELLPPVQPEPAPREPVQLEPVQPGEENPQGLLLRGDAIPPGPPGQRDAIPPDPPGEAELLVVGAGEEEAW
ncbi:MAG TPA: hypothetical protein VF070_17540 [Streptosporangiaceae bacterium]